MVFNYVFREALHRAYDVLKAADNNGIKFVKIFYFSWRNTSQKRVSLV